MIPSETTARVLALMEEITSVGPSLPEFDGLRVFDHEDRLRLHLLGKRDEVPPVTLDLWPSLTCNAMCPLCQYRVSGAREEVDQTGRLALMSVALANRIFAGATSAGVRSVILTGGGEPTLNPDLILIARSAVEHGLKWSLNTNAFTIDERLALGLLREGPEYIKISVDAGTAGAHSQIYSVSTDHFSRVVDNAIATIRASGTLGKRKIGLSFTLAAKTSDSELCSIRDTIRHILDETNGALGFVVFRARLLHYRGSKPVVPQPSFLRFTSLAEGIENRIVAPLEKEWPRTRFDLKKGLFLLAAREHLPVGSLSNSWMTTVTHEGEGYATGELAGAEASNQCWGRVGAHEHDFAALWGGVARRELHRQIEIGAIPLPIVHRTSPIDEFLRRLNSIVGDRVPENLAHEIIVSVRQAKWYRSKNSSFV